MAGIKEKSIGPRWPRPAPVFNMFYIIGLGLSDEKDITLRGLEVKIPENALFGAKS